MDPRGTIGIVRVLNGLTALLALSIGSPAPCGAGDDFVPPVQALECARLDGGVLLMWSNPIAYDSHAIYRYDELIATLPGSDNSYLNPGVPPPDGRYVIISSYSEGSNEAVCRVGEHPPALRVTDAQGHAGGSVSVRVFLDDVMDEGILGWGIGVRHDGSKLALLAVKDGALTRTVKGGGPPDFDLVDRRPRACQPPELDGFTAGCIIDFDAVAFLPPGTGYELYVVTYALEASAPDSTELSFSSDLGCPPFGTFLTYPGNDIVPRLFNGTVTIRDPLFQRGDANNDGNIDIADAVRILSFLFTGGAVLSCVDAADINDDGKLNIADPISILSRLFAGAPALPPPFLSCGTDPTADELNCIEFPPCDGP